MGRVTCPAADVLLRVRPEEVAEESRVGHLDGPHDSVNLLQTRELRTQAAVHANDLLVDDCAHRQAVEAISEAFP